MSDVEYNKRSNRIDFLIFFWHLVMIYASVVIMEQTSNFHTTAFLFLTGLCLATLMVVGLSRDSGYRDMFGRRVFTALKFFIWAGFVSALLALVEPYAAAHA